MTDKSPTTEKLDIWPLGMSAEIGYGVTIILPEYPQTVWLCWDEVVQLRAWLTKIIEAETVANDPKTTASDQMRAFLEVLEKNHGVLKDLGHD